MATSENVCNRIFPINRSCGFCRGTGIIVVGQDDLSTVCPNCSDLFLLKVEAFCKEIINKQPHYSEDWNDYLDQLRDYILDMQFQSHAILSMLHCEPVKPEEELDIPF